MTVVLAALLAAVFVAALLLGWAARREHHAVLRAESASTELSTRVSAALGAAEAAELQMRAADVRAQAAEGRLRAAEQRAAEAERKAGEAERRVGEAMRRADEAERAGAESDAARAVWDLERLRVEREWLDVVGPGVPLPVPWDGTVGAVVATELSVIREVIGTPSELSVQSPPRPPSPGQAAVVARVSVELLRTLARSGEEMQVTVDGREMMVMQPHHPADRPPDLAALTGVAQAAGLQLNFDLQEERSIARLALG